MTASIYLCFPPGEACTGGAQEQGAERRSDSVRSPNRFYVPPLRPPATTPDPEEHPSPHLFPTCPHLSTPLPYSPILLWNYHSLRHHPETVGGSNGVGGGQKKNKSKNDLKKRKINVSRPLFPKKQKKKNVFASFEMRRREKKNPIDKRQWVLVFCKYFFFCYIQYDTSSKSIDCSVPFFSI